jgi:hypothetical protein
MASYHTSITITTPSKSAFSLATHLKWSRSSCVAPGTISPVILASSSTDRYPDLSKSYLGRCSRSAISTASNQGLQALFPMQSS